MNRTQFFLKPWQRMLLVLLVCLTAGYTNLRAATHFNNPEQSWVRHQPTLKEPWFSVVMMFYDSDGKDSFFLHNNTEGNNPGPAVYIDGKYACSPNYELAWPGDSKKGNESGLSKQVSENEWWGDIYESDDYVIRFWNPWQDDHNEVDKSGHYRYRVTMYVYLKVWDANAKHTVTVKGTWKINDTSTEEESASWTINPFSNSWVEPVGVRIDHKTVSVSGSLIKGLENSTHIGLYTQSEKTPKEYISDNLLFSGNTKVGKEISSYSELKAEFTSTTYDINKHLPVQYSTVVTHEGCVTASTPHRKLDMVVYKWFDLTVPGFVYADPYPDSITVMTSQQWDKKVAVSWKAVDKNVTDAPRSQAGTWTIKNLTTKSILERNIPYGTTVKEVVLDDYETPYTLQVGFVPSGLGDNIPDELSVKVNAAIYPVWNFNEFVAKEVDEGINLKWSHSPFERASGNNAYTIVVQRSTDYDSSIPDSATWINVENIDVKNPDINEGSYLDPNSNLAPNKTYYYRLMTNVLGANHFSDIRSAKLGGSKIQSFVASRGTYSNIVKLQWSVKQVGYDDTNFTVQRRPLDSNNESDWADIYTTAGTGSTYSYDDVTALPGSFNSYKLIIWTMQDGKRSDDDSETTDGFSLTSGIISGNIAYGTGTAVQGAKVTLKQQDSDGEMASALRSVHFSGYGAGFKYDCDPTTLKSMVGGSFSIQAYVYPDSISMHTNQGCYQLVDIYNTFGIYLRYNETIRQYRVGMSLGDNKYDSDLFIAPNAWSHISLVHNADSMTTTVFVMEDDKAKGQILRRRIITGDDQEPVREIPVVSNEAKCLSIGNNSNFDSGTYFNGYLDEFRFWTKALTEDDIRKNYNHPIVGDEKSLFIYYPFDEGLAKQTIAYDFSKSNGIGGGRHAKTYKSPAEGSTVVPNENQLSLMGYTNVDGAYTIRGVGFSGEGTSYNVIPTLGIHEFSPSMRTRFVSMSSLNHSGVDFEDVSSFPVSGKVFYAGTDYPVEGANFYVDGTICAKDGQMITSNEQGEFTISVPIGDHFITVAKNGHVFANGGRYPVDRGGVGVKHTFNQEIKNLEFTDSTMVNFTGRVVGGDIEGGKELGFGLSQNNIGIAELVLTPQKEAPRMNVEKVINETTYSYETGTEIMPVTSATRDINSTAWRGAGADDCRNIYIHTDSLTGEFSAMVPPLQYSVDKIKVVKTGLQFGSPQVIDLSNPLIERTDSIDVDSITRAYYSYHTKLMQTYHSDPVFTVVQDDHQDGAFGISTYTLSDEIGELTIDDIYSIDESGNPVYKYGGAIFDEYDNYTFNISAYEEYVNSDGNMPVTSQVPLKNLVVTIDNALSSEQAVASEDVTYEGTAYSAGDVVGLKSNQLRLDSLGCATYLWTAGLPNISTPYTRTITISYNIGDRTHLWKDTGLTGIVLGDMPTGNNFVTSGPDMLQMILRDPPGSKSSAEWTSGTVTSESYFHSGTLTLDAYENKKVHMGPKITTAAGTGIWVETEVETIGELDLGIKGQVDFKGGRKYLTTIENTKAVTTSDAIEFVGAPGDIFIGSATNVIFGAANSVGFHRVGATDEVKLDVEESVSTGLSFSTMFSYTQNYIENMLLPNFELMRNNMLKTVTQDIYDGYNSGSIKNEGTTPLYLTTLASGDPDFGKDKTYLMVDPIDAKDGYQDSVQWCNSQIESWIKYLKFNEAEKVRAYENREDKDSVDYQNFSINSGTSVSNTYEKERYSEGTHIDFALSVAAHLYFAMGGTVNGMGAEVNLGGDIVPGYSLEYEKTVNDKTGFKYTLAEDGDDNALSVDVYDYGAYGPIFRTRGGQTSAPYEGRAVTKYYEPGTTIMEPTMQIEVPQIDVDQSTLSDIPSGSTATFTLHLRNASETNELLYYRLGLAEDTNPNGAMLFIDGAPVTDVRTILIQPHETVTKTLLLKQSDLSILDYNDIGIVLASSSQYYPTYTWDVIADTAFISAQFVPSSSPVTLELSNNLMNTHTGTNLVLTMRDFDRNYRGQKAFRMQYKKEGAKDWKTVHEYVLSDADKNDNNDLLPINVSSVSFTLSMDSYYDGDYLFRIESASAGGTDEVTRYSEEIPLVKDLQSPTPIGIPEPSDGILDIGDELSVTFNENILKGELTSEANFRVTGVLNGAEIEHETALSLPATETAVAATEADINLDGKDFSFDMWVNLSEGAGTLLKHGTGASKLIVGIDDKEQMTVNISGKTYISTQTVPTGKWAFLSLSLTSDGLLNASVATDADETYLFFNQKTISYDGHGPLSVGKDIKGAIHELLLWDEAHDMTTALLNRSKTKNPSTRHLIGYWKMNEGEGTTIRDYARNRHMTMPDETWYLNNENKAVSLDGAHFVSINASELPVCVNDDYALEFWMRGGAQTGEAQLLQMGDIALSLSADGTLLLTGKDAYNPATAQTLATSADKLTDNAWHHVALNVLRQGTAAVYVDGKRCLSTNAANVGSINTNNLIVGARRVTDFALYLYDHPFCGQIDEVRVWNATMNGDLLTSNRKVRLTGSEDGLVAYYPFEKKSLDDGNQVVTVGDAADLTGSAGEARLCSMLNEQSSMNYTDDAPALRTKPTETNVSFTYVASNEKVVISIEEDAATIEGCTLNFTVCNVRDEHGNNSVPAVWSAFVNQKELEWKESSVGCSVTATNEATLTANIVNKSGTQQMWSLSGMPAWLIASEDYGTTNPLDETAVTFTVSPATPIGKYEETIYLMSNNGIETPLTVNVTVTGEVPDWAVNPNGFEHSMNVIGQLEIQGVPVTDTDDIVAAFIGEECRGVAHPAYMERYDSYYVTIDIYGNNDENKKVTFRAYDASTGTLYPVIELDTISFKTLDLVGRYEDPVVLNALDKIEQSTRLKAGWNWLSFYVKADSMKASALLEKIADDVIAIKNQEDWLMREDSTWGGSLNYDLTNDQMYAVKLKADCTLRVVGDPVDPATCPITLHNGWKWLGYYGRQLSSVADAMAGMSPENGDILKGQTGVTYFANYEWAGSLLAMEPGVGYMVYATSPRQFGYPAGPKKVKSLNAELSTPNASFTPIDFHTYSSNAIMALKVMQAGSQPLSNVEVGVFADDECRASAFTSEDGTAWLTIPGDEEAALSFRIAIGDQVLQYAETVNYEADAIYGSPLHPLVLDLGEIGDLSGDAWSGTWYDISGRKVLKGQVPQGVYIVNGQKRVVK